MHPVQKLQHEGMRRLKSLRSRQELRRLRPGVEDGHDHSVTIRARQVRDKTVERASQSMLTYVEAMGGPEACDPAVIEIHFDAIRNLLSHTEMEEGEADRIGRNLEAVVSRKSARRLVAVG